ncbi:response regulator [Rhizobiaceae bacterium n13]|uniref:Response regulator n=1 Tax=Ferirhizobium litorale TaxID=2927786 RepID=A0AAE3QG09_9HYPH|nr:response regulator [Fererhizobium litorale]MDI7865112.1 response regulator [Fererhizobium litorale]MDI7925112.1 response regulator [Fererhizobium litorale]
MGGRSPHERQVPELNTPRSILIAEDEFLIALDLEDTLVRAGYTDTSIYSSCSQAIAALSIKIPSVALLDIHLHDGSCIELATELKARGIPFIVCSAWPKSDVPEIFLQAPWVSKPYNETELLTAVVQAMEASVRAPRHRDLEHEH